MASSDWIAFLDSDDFWFLEKIEKVLTPIEHNPGANFLSHD